MIIKAIFKNEDQRTGYKKGLPYILDMTFAMVRAPYSRNKTEMILIRTTIDTDPDPIFYESLAGMLESWDILPV